MDNENARGLTVAWAKLMAAQACVHDIRDLVSDGSPATNFACGKALGAIADAIEKIELDLLDAKAEELGISPISRP